MEKDLKKTEQEFRTVIKECREIFEKKLHDYGASWRILRPTALTDQLFIKAKRIRSLELKQVNMVGEGIRPEFLALINYGIVGLIQLDRGFVDTVDITPQEAMALYDQWAGEALTLMTKKNHDYDEAWREMRVTSYTDFILTKLQRIKEIEDLADGYLCQYVPGHAEDRVVSPQKPDRHRYAARKAFGFQFPGQHRAERGHAPAREIPGGRAAPVLPGDEAEGGRKRAGADGRQGPLEAGPGQRDPEGQAEGVVLR